ASGSGAVDAAEIALIDPTVLPEGDYRISILASDGAQTGGIEYRVNVGTGYKPGRVRFSVNDATLDLAGIPLSIGRVYDSLAAGPHGRSDSGDLAPGWRLSLSASVTDSARDPDDPEDPFSQLLAEAFTGQTRVYVVKPDGNRVGFTFAPRPKSFPSLFQFDVAFEPDPGVTDTLRAVDGPQVVWALGAGFGDWIVPYNPSRYELETADGVIYVISETSGLQEVRDALGGVTTIGPDGLSSSWGPSLHYVRDAQGRIIEILLPAPEPGDPRPRVLYGYDSAGNLVSVTNRAGQSTDYLYQNPEFPHHLTGILDPLGQPLVLQVFDENGRLAAHCPPDGDIATLDGCSSFEYDLAAGIETVFDPRGFRSELFYDENGWLVLRRDWIDLAQTEFSEQRWTYDARGRAVEYVDPEGGVTRRAFDDRDNLVREEMPDGLVLQWEYGDCPNAYTAMIEPNGSRWERDFDENCRPIALRDPLGGTTRYSYDARGLKTGITDPVGQLLQVTYTQTGKPLTVTHPDGGVTTYQYNGLGQLSSVIDRAGRERRFLFDEANRMRRELWVGTGEVIDWEYDELGMVRRVTAPDSVVEIDYWPTGRIRRIDHAAPGAPTWWVQYDYDGSNNLIRVTDSAGGVTEYDYNGLNQLIGIRQTGTAVVPKSVAVERLKSGLPERLSRLAGPQLDLPGPVTEYRYDCNSCPTSRNAMHHLQSDGSPLHSIELNRDGTRRVSGFQDPDGLHQMIYDGRGWLIESGHPPASGIVGGITVWDQAGNWLSRPEADGPADLGYASPAGGHVLLNDGRYQYQYDAVGNLTRRFDPITGQALELSYDYWDLLIEVELSASDGTVLETASYRYSPYGWRVFAELDGQRRHFMFDRDNVHAALDDNGSVLWRRLNGNQLDQV
ncbi:MAG: hypothetical protein V2J10_07900, partial [Wenzhouxiangella sp.]|nr:hypothetical protein [Wenzhouxiangella sp.]